MDQFERGWLQREMQAAVKEYNKGQRTWGEWKDRDMVCNFKVHFDYMSGEYWLVNGNHPGERYAIAEVHVENGAWKNANIPIEAKAALAIHLRQKGSIIPSTKEVEQRRHIPEVVERTGDKWYSWGLLRIKHVNGQWVVKAATQLEDSNDTPQHSSMAGYGRTKVEALNDLLEQMYETRALIEDAIVNVKARTLEEKKAQGEE